MAAVPSMVCMHPVICVLAVIGHGSGLWVVVVDVRVVLRRMGMRFRMMVMLVMMLVRIVRAHGTVV